MSKTNKSKNTSKTSQIANFNDVAAHVSRCAISLTDSEPQIRKKALESLKELLFESSSLTPQEYGKLFRELCKPLFRRFSDPTEKCRELAQIITKGFFQRCNDFTAVLAYFFPCIMERIPAGAAYDESLKIFVTNHESHEAYKRGRAVERQDKVAETVIVELSEEIRLKCCDTMDSLIRKAIEINCCPVLHAYFEDVIMFLQIHVRDPNPEVKLMVCSTLERLAIVPDFELGLKYYSVALVRNLLPLFRHRHAKIRAGAVGALHRCMVVPDREKRKASGSDAIPDLVGFREENVLPVSAFYKSEVQINYFAEIISDNSPIVREKIVSLLRSLLTEIGDRYDHQTRLLPYLLDLLMDDVDSIAQSSLDCLQKCGDQYEEEHPDDIIERRQYGIDGDDRINLEKPLPHPFNARPRIGVRLYVRGNTKRFLSALVGELTNWIAPTRAKSARLLKLIVVLCEEHLTMDVNVLLPSLIKALRFARQDQDLVLQEALIELFELLGRYLLPDIYIFFILPRLRGDVDVTQAGDSEWKLCTMIMLKQLLCGSKASQVVHHFEEIVSVLTDEFVIPSESTQLELGAIEIIEVILQSLRGKQSGIVESYYLSTGRLTSLHQTLETLFKFSLQRLSNSCLAVKAQNVLRLLSMINNDQNFSLEKLFRKFSVQVLRYAVERFPKDYPCPSDLQLILKLVECPFLVLYSDESVLKTVILLLVNAVKGSIGMDKSVEQEWLKSISELLIKALTPLASNEYSLEGLDYFRHLYDLDNQKLPGLKTVSITAWENASTTIRENLSLLLETFVLDIRWNISNDLLLFRLQFLDLFLSKIDGYLVFWSEEKIIDICPKLSQCVLSATLLNQSISSTVKLMTLEVFESIVAHIKSHLQIDKILCFRKYKEAFLQENQYRAAKVNFQPMIYDLVIALDDGNDLVRIAALESLMRLVPFIFEDHDESLKDSNFQSGELAAFSKILKVLLVKLRLERETNAEENEFVDLLDQVLRCICILDPYAFESIIKAEIVDSSTNSEVLLSDLNGLINHATIIDSLTRR